MLKLLLGASGSGKTTLLYQRIRARAEAGGRSILLVPEQFTSSTEGRIHRELGDALSGLVESFSFTSLAEHILSAEGGSAVQTLSDAGRAVLVRRALEELQDNVHYYYRHRRSAAFCQMAAETIDELKSAGLSGQRLYALAQECGADSAKLSELALIFQGYETLLAGTGMDPSDRLTLAASRLESALARGGLPEFLRGREVFIDEFDTFNAPKKRLMGALLASLPTVTVALCDDGAPLIPGDMSLFSGAKQVAAQLRQLARRSGTEVAIMVEKVEPGRAWMGFVDGVAERPMYERLLVRPVSWKESDARKWCNTDLVQDLPEDLVSIITPRTIRQTVEDKELVTTDLLWLHSATEFFGRRPWASGDDPTEEQLPVYKTERDRVKMWNGRTWPHYTRSVYASYSVNFCLVYTDGAADDSSADHSRAVAPGFWI